MLALLTSVMLLAPPGAAATIDPVRVAREAELDRVELALLTRQIADLEAAAELELDPTARPKLRLMVAEVYLERARKHRFVASERQRWTESGAGDALPVDGDDHTLSADLDEAAAVDVLDATRSDPHATPELRRSVLWTLADLIVQRDEPMRAVALLRELAEIAGEPCLKARALAKEADIYVRLNERQVIDEARRRFEEANELCGSIKHVLGAAQAHERLGDAEFALDAYARVMAHPPTDEQVQNAQRYAQSAIARLLAADREFAEAAAYVEGLGEAGDPVWFRLGQSFMHRRRPAEAMPAFGRAIHRDPSVERRVWARSQVVTATIATGVPARVTAAVRALDEHWSTLEGLPDTYAPQMALRWEQAVRDAIGELRGPRAEQWEEPDAQAVIHVYLRRFPEAEFAPYARFVRALRRAERSDVTTPCVEHETNAEDFAVVLDALDERDPPVAERAGLYAVRSLDACRPIAASGAKRPATGPSDVALLELGARFHKALPDATGAGEVDVLMARVHFAHQNDATARDLYRAALTRPGTHRTEAVRGLARVLWVMSRWDELEAMALESAEEVDLPEPLRAELSALAAEAAFAAAQGAAPSERAERLVEHASRYPDAPSASEALLAAGLAFAERGRSGDAHTVLTQAVATYGDTAAGQRALLALAQFMEARGRTTEAAERYTQYLEGTPPDAVDRAALKGRVEMYWMALGDRARALAIRTLDAAPEERARTFLAGAVDAITAGEVEMARRLAEEADAGLAAPDRAVARAIAGCQRDAPLEPKRLRITRAPDRLRWVLAACGAAQLEHALTSLPGATHNPVDDLNRSLRYRHRLETFAFYLVQIEEPIASARAQLAIAVVCDHLARVLRRVAEHGTPSAGALAEEARRQAIELWQAAFETSHAYGIDGALSRRVDAVAERLLEIPEPAPPARDGQGDPLVRDDSGSDGAREGDGP